MSKKNNKTSDDNFSVDLPVEVISKAVAGDAAAIAEVLKAYEPYIIAQATTKVKNADGSVTETVDEDMAQTLREALIREIPNFKAET